MQTLADLPFVGGHPALDLVNTAEERGHPEAGDVLQTPADLWLWGVRRGLLDEHDDREGPDAAAEFPRAIAARELLHELFQSRAEGRSAQPDELARLATLAAEAHAAARIVQTADGSLSLEWDRSTLASVRHAAVAGAFDLLAEAPNGRLKQCPGDRCGWLFLDTTKRGNRRWCSMAECGQDAKDEQRRAQRAASRISRQR